MAGVIYIQTKRGSKKKGVHGSFGTQYGNNFYLDKNNHSTQTYLDISYLTNGKSVFLGGSFDYNYDWISAYTLDKKGNLIPNIRRDLGNYNVFGGADFEFADIHKLNFNVSYDERIEPLSKEASENSSYYNTYGNIESPGKFLLANIAYKVYPTDKLDITLHSGINYEDAFRIFSSKVDDMDKERFIANNTDLMIAYSPTLDSQLKTGYSFDYNRRSQIESLASENHHYNTLHHALYLGYDYQYQGKVGVNLTIGGRYQFNQRYSSIGKGLGIVDKRLDNAHSFSPEFGLVIKPHRTLAIKGHIGHSFKTPNIELAMMDGYKGGPRKGLDYVTFGNPLMKHEQSVGYSGTIEYNPIPELLFSFGMYRNDIWDMIGTVYTGEVYNINGVDYDKKIYENIGKAYTWGTSLSLSTGVEVKKLGLISGRLSFEYMLGRELHTDSTGIYINEDGTIILNPILPNRPPIVVSGSIGWTQSTWGTSILLSGYYFHSMYNYESVKLDDGSTTNKLRRTENQTTMDIKITPKKYKNKENDFKSMIFFEVKNLLNASYDSDFDGDTDQAERRFLIGLNMEF